MKLTMLSTLALPVAILALTSACQSTEEEALGDGNSAVRTRSPGSDAGSGSSRASASTIATGKYVSNGKMLMIYGRCSPENFLGDTAKGDLGADGQTISVEEGSLCRSYKLTPKAAGVVSVTWNKPASANLGADLEEVCRSLEGEYAMTVSGAFQDLEPGVYKKGSVSLRVDRGCESPSMLGNTKGTIIPTLIGGEAKPFFKVAEGNLCNGYLIEKQAGGLKVTWERPEYADLGDDLIRDCASAEGTYANTTTASSGDAP